MTEYRGQGTADASTATTTSVLRETATATASQTVFNLSTAVYTPGTNELSVFVDGLKKLLTTDYAETSASIVTFASGMTGGEVVEFVAEVGGVALDTTDATKSVFTHDQSGATQTTVDIVLKALAVDLTADLKAVSGAEAQTAYVRGRDSAGDGYSGFYYWNATSTATDTSATTTLVVQQNGVTTGRWLKNTVDTHSGTVTMGADLIVSGTTESTTVATGSITAAGGVGITKNVTVGQDVVMGEQADASSTPVAGHGYLWTKSTTPSTLFFTDDAGTPFDISAATAGGTITIADEIADTTCFPIFATDATGAVSGKSNTSLTYNSATSNLASTTFTGALVGNASTATTAGTVTTAAQANITSVGTLTSLDVDDVQINGGTVTTTSGGLTLDSNTGTTTVADALTVTGAFTSVGIDDNATREALQLGDTSAALGATGDLNFSLYHADSAGEAILYLSGGSSSNLGGNILLGGESHATVDGDIRLRSGSNTFLNWDESGGYLSFSTGIGSKTTALTIGAGQASTFAGNITASTTGTNTLITANGGTGYGGFSANGSGTNPSYVFFKSGGVETARIQATNADVMTLKTGVGATTALTLDASQNATFAGDLTVSGDLTVDSIVQPKTKIIDIGDWNMDTTTSVAINHGLTFADIRSCSVLIRTDVDTQRYSIDYDVGTGAAGYFIVGSTAVTISRAVSGNFDSTAYDQTSYNRGWITITYV